jgi:hypothetical protein
MWRQTVVPELDFERKIYSKVATAFVAIIVATEILWLDITALYKPKDPFL